MISSLRPGAGAAAGAEAPVVGALLGSLNEEGRAASLAVSLYGPVAPSSRSGDLQVGISDEVGAAASGVAAVAGRHQVGAAVVPAVAVNVIDDQVSPTGGPADRPSDHLPAPVAGVGAGADRVVQNDPVRPNAAPFGRQGVVWGVDGVIAVGQKFARGGNNLRLAPAHVPARAGAVRDFRLHLGRVAAELHGARAASVGLLFNHKINCSPKGVC